MRRANRHVLICGLRCRRDAEDGGPGGAGGDPGGRGRRARRRTPRSTAGPGPRPGPDILYGRPADAPQLRTRASGSAEPILVSGASAYRDGEFLYQDFLYDDHGARAARDPGDPRSGDDTFSRAERHLHVPDRPGRTRNNAADLVELRVKPLAGRDRVPHHAQHDQGRRARSAPRSRSAARRLPLPFPHGANVTAPAALFLTVHGATAELLDAATGQPVAGGAADRERRHRRGARSRSACRTAAGTRAAAGRAPGRRRRALGHGGRRATSRRGRPRRATQPGGAGRRRPGAPAFFNVAFRFDEPLPDVAEPDRARRPGLVARPARRRTRCATGDIRPFHADVDFGKLAPTATTTCRRARRRAADRPASTASSPATSRPSRASTSTSELRQLRRDCKGELRGRLQPYAIYVPDKPRPAGGYGLHAAAALARRQLQPVLGDAATSRSSASAGRGSHRDHRRRAAARTAGTTTTRAPTRSRCGPTSRATTSSTRRWTVDRRLLDGRLRHVQVRDPVPGPVRQGASRRSARPASGVWVPPADPQPGGAQSNTHPPCSPRCATSRS